MQSDAHVSSPPPANVGGSAGNSGPPDMTLLGRWNTVTRQPPELGRITATLIRITGQNGVANRKTLIREFEKIQSGDRQVYNVKDASELFDFLLAYGVLYRKNERWIVETQRMQELTIACDNHKPLPYDFVVSITPGEACGCPQPADIIAPPAPEKALVVKPPALEEPKPFVVKRVAFMTASEIRVVEAIAICQVDTVVGELRSPVHMSDQVCKESDIGAYFGGERELFVVELRRLVNAGIVEIRKGTGPGGEYDALALTMPYEELKLVIHPIAVRHPVAVPRHVDDVIARVLALEGLNVSKGGLHATVRASVVARLKSRGVAADPDKLADVITHRMIRHHPAAPEKGWGLAIQGRDGVDAVICYPGLTSVEFVPIARDVFAEDVETERLDTPVIQAPPAPPRFIAVSDVGEGMSEVDLDLIITDAPALIAAAQAEKERRVEAARVAADLALKAARRADLERRREAAAAEAARVAAELEAIEAELAVA